MDFIFELILFYFRYLPLICGAFIIITILRVPDLTLETSWSISSIVSCLFTEYLSPFASVYIGLLVGACCGLLTGMIFIIIGRKKMLAGLISYTVLTAIGYHLLGNNASIYTKNAFVHFGVTPAFSHAFYFTQAILIVLLISLLMKSKYGINMRLVGENPYASFFYKISINKTFLVGFILANSIIGFGGSLWGVYYGFASNTQGIGLVLISFMALLLGEEIIYILKLSKRTNVLVVIIGTMVFVFLNQLNELIINKVQLFGLSIRVTDKNLIMALFLVLLISFRRSQNSKSEIVSQW